MARASAKCIYASVDNDGGFKLNRNDTAGNGKKDARFVTRLRRQAGKRQIASQLMEMEGA